LPTDWLAACALVCVEVNPPRLSQGLSAALLHRAEEQAEPLVHWVCVCAATVVLVSKLAVLVKVLEVC